MTELKSQFLLDPEVVFLNHGSFGACPRPVFDAYQHWQRELERQPVEFLGRRARGLLAEARAALAAYVGVEAQDVVYFPNPTAAINAVVRSLDLGPGDEILTTDHEYGAMDRTWRFACRKTGARYVQQPVPLPVTAHSDFVEIFWAAVTDRTRAIFLSHITSPTALTFPVQEICYRARQAGLLSIVDGAHAPGQIPLNLEGLGADVYTGAAHKWLCAPKGSAFLYVRREVQGLLEPLVVSWGWESEHPSGSQFIDHHEWQGTRDLAAFLSVPAAIEFQAGHDWAAVRQRCRALAGKTRQRLNALTGLDPICPDSPEWFTQMFAARLPPADLDRLKGRLYDEYRIEVPLRQWNGQPLIRVSFQAYNGQADADALVDALAQLLPLTSP
ncbi:MAG: aminotransferase class V-fold PLP-dependent enzyme [Anaerolineae bacterium]|nr:MAG: aminotransferase class V-fold PLP-dependent enzyme [Anaerolineae bacterium]